MYSRYRVITASSIPGLEAKVQKMFPQYWEPIGGVSYNTLENCYMQTMVVDAGNHNAHMTANLVYRDNED